MFPFLVKPQPWVKTHTVLLRNRSSPVKEIKKKRKEKEGMQIIGNPVMGGRKLCRVWMNQGRM